MIPEPNRTAEPNRTDSAVVVRRRTTEPAEHRTEPNRTAEPITLRLLELPAEPNRRTWRPDLWPWWLWGPLLALPGLAVALVVSILVRVLATVAGLN